MAHLYRVLQPNLQSTADAAIRYFATEFGVKQSSVAIESEVHQSVGFRPTLQFPSNDKHVLCVEVVEILYPPEIKDFILSCRNHSIPAKLFCIIPAGTMPQVDIKAIQYAIENGISIIEINPDSGAANVVNGSATSLSLGGLRSFKLTDYPPQYRVALQEAISTFRGGNPTKGCANVYDELEALTRRICTKISAIPGGFRTQTTMNWQTAAWHSVLEFLKNNADLQVIGCPDLKSQLLSRLIGITEYRNETGHKPRTLTSLINRDKELKTRFESAMDELLKTINAAKPLRIKS